jgi:site-specific recombinase XerD
MNKVQKAQYKPGQKRTSGENKEYLLRNTEPRYRSILEEYITAMNRESYSWNTVKEYSRRFCTFMKAIEPLTPDSIGEARVNRYLAEMAEVGVSESLLNSTISAIKIYYDKVAFIPDFKLERIKRPRKARALPVVLSMAEVDRMLRATENLKHICLLYTLYGHGLRLGEVLNLRTVDIHWDRNQIFVHRGKGRKDRYVVMSAAFKEMLRIYFHEYKPGYWLFEGQEAGTQYSERSVQQVVRQAAQKAGISKRVTPHTLRHCYATHLLDAGTQIPLIRELLGHADIKTTMIYAHITTASMDKVVSPLDRLLANIERKSGQNPQLE